MVTVGEGLVKTLGELFKVYVTSRSEETRYKAFESGKKLFKERMPPDRVVGLYIETIKSLEGRKGFKTSGCEDLLLKMMMAYSSSFLEDIELKERLLKASESRFKKLFDNVGDGVFQIDL